MASSIFIGWFGGVQYSTSGSTVIFPNVQVTGQFIGPAADNTAAPPFSFAGDLNTGVGSAAADTLDLVTGGTSRVSVSTTAVASGVPIVGPAGTGAAPGIAVGEVGTGLNLSAGSGFLGFSAGGANQAYLGVSQLLLRKNDFSIFFGTADDVSLSRGAANLLQLAQDDNFSLVRGYIQGFEQTAPAAPAADGYRIFAQDNGAGKTQLMVIFNSGAAQQIAIQP